MESTEVPARSQTTCRSEYQEDGCALLLPVHWRMAHGVSILNMLLPTGLSVATLNISEWVWQCLCSCNAPIVQSRDAGSVSRSKRSPRVLSLDEKVKGEVIVRGYIHVTSVTEYWDSVLLQ